MTFRMRIRLLFWVLPLLLIVAAAGVFALLATQQREALRASFADELLEEGSVTVEPYAEEFFAHLGHHVDDTGVTEEEFADAVKEVAGDERAAVLFDFAGNDLLREASDPQLRRLLSSARLLELVSAYQREGDAAGTITIDNYEAFLNGQAPYPARARFKVYDSPKVILGHGRVQNSGRIRLETAYAVAHRNWIMLLAGMAGVLLLSAVVLFLLSEFLVRRWVSAPLAAFRAEAAALGGDGSEGAALPARPDLEHITAALRQLGQDHADARADLAEERTARYRAEEERDRLQSEFDRQLRDAEKRVADAQALQLNDERAALHRRVARGLGAKHAAALGLGVNGGAKDAPESIDLASWIQEVAGGVTLPGGVVLESRVDEGLQLRGHADQLRRAMQALLSNAVDALRDQRDGRIAVDAAAVEGGVEIRVSDNGPGIPEAVRPLVTTPLFSTREDALGVGLGIAGQVAEAHGGTLEIQSEEGKGTVAILRLSNPEA